MLNPLLPSARITAGVETGDYEQCVTVNHEKQHIGETPQESAADALVDGGELQGG